MPETLFDYETKLICHKTNPDTSRQAAQTTIKKLTDKQKYVFRIIRNYCQNHIDFTPKEVACGINTLYFDIQRRKNELALKGWIAKTGEERNGCEVWRLV